jgi:hypothetical protein
MPSLHNIRLSSTLKYVGWDSCWFRVLLPEGQHSMEKESNKFSRVT